MNDTIHVPVLSKEILEIMKGYERIVVDATCGNGGHSYLMASEFRDTMKKLLCFDRDEESLNIARKRLSGFDFIDFFPLPYSRLHEITTQKKLEPSFVLFDLGLSMWQIKSSGRGFTFHEEEPLDMRFNNTQGEPLYVKLKKLPPDEIKFILKSYGDVKGANRIAEYLVKERKRLSIKTTGQLVRLLRELHIPKAEIQKVFMAFRIYINNELYELINGIKAAILSIKKGGRMAFITYHSIEDRIVKKISGIKGMYRVEPYPIYPDRNEIRANRAARSAKLRVFQKGEEDVKETHFSVLDSVGSSFPAPVSC